MGKEREREREEAVTETHISLNAISGLVFDEAFAISQAANEYAA